MPQKISKLSIIIPAFNEEATIHHLLQKIFSANTLDLEKEIIIIDDGSYDQTYDILKISELPFILIRNKNNKGKGYSIQQGLRKATGDIVLIQDADLEYSPSDYPKLLSPLISGESNIVFGRRELDFKNTHFLTTLARVCFATLINFLYGSKLSDINTCYKAFKTDIIKNFHLKTKGFSFCAEVTTLSLINKEKIIEVPIKYTPRSKKEGKKIRFYDGFAFLFMILKNRFTNKSSLSGERKV